MSLFQSNLRKQIRKLPKFLQFVKIIHYYSELFTSLLTDDCQKSVTQCSEARSGGSCANELLLRDYGARAAEPLHREHGSLFDHGGRGVGEQAGDRPNFGGLVLGCSEADFRNPILVGKVSTRSIRLMFLCTATLAKFQQIFVKRFAFHRDFRRFS